MSLSRTRIGGMISHFYTTILLLFLQYWRCSFTKYGIIIIISTLATSTVASEESKVPDQAQSPTITSYNHIDDQHHHHHIQNMVDWLHSFPGGYLNPKVEIRKLDPMDPSSYYGMFAVRDIKKGELILRIPGELKLEVEDPTDYYVEDLCTLAWMLQREWELGNDVSFGSFFLNFGGCLYTVSIVLMMGLV